MATFSREMKEGSVINQLLIITVNQLSCLGYTRLVSEFAVHMSKGSKSTCPKVQNTYLKQIFKDQSFDVGQEVDANQAEQPMK